MSLQAILPYPISQHITAQEGVLHYIHTDATQAVFTLEVILHIYLKMTPSSIPGVNCLFFHISQRIIHTTDATLLSIRASKLLSLNLS